MYLKKTSIVFLSFLLIFSSCSNQRKTDFRVYRFIDNLEKENILSSPLIEIVESDRIFPSNSYPLLDLGIKNNPCSLKRKLRIGGSERNVIFSPPKSEYSYTVDLSGDSVLEFGIGIVKEENSFETEKNTKSKGEGVNFLVSLVINGKKKIVFQKYLPLPIKEPYLSFSRHKIDLPYDYDNVHLVFTAKGKEEEFSFWYNPVLYRKEKNSLKIILISVDTLRADHLGCYGYYRDTSPNVDSLASDSALFLNTYASSPWTLPSHVSLLTSLYGIHHQVYYDKEKMDPTMLTLADLLRKNHFFCSAFTGGGFVSASYGFSKGFDSYYEGEGGVYNQDSAERVFRVASEWLDRNEDKNFFLFIHTYQTHNPYACPYPYKTMFVNQQARWRHIDLIGYLGGQGGIFNCLPDEERKNIVDLYDGEIRYTDEKLVGALVEKLKDMNIYDETMIIFTSDHGEEFYDHKGWGHGHSLYDEIIKVPLIIKFPDSRFREKKINNIVSLVDVMPTILEEVGVNFNESNFDGRTLFPVLEGKEKESRAFLADVADNILNSHIPQKTAMNFGNKKLIINRRFTEEDSAFFFSPPPSFPAVELFDVKEDRFEKENIADKEPKIVNLILKQTEELYDEAKKRKILKMEIDKKLLEQLKALGYVH